MTLYIIGLGLHDADDITVKGLNIVKSVSKVYLEAYTSILQCEKEDLEKLYGRKVLIADREFVENTPDELLKTAKDADAAFLVVGDPMSATTHIDLVLRARKLGIKVEIIHNAGVLTAVGVIGLELYKYGKTTSIVFPEDDWKVETHYNTILENQKMGLHTLCLLDIKMKEPSKEDMKKDSADTVTKDHTDYSQPRFMTIQQAIQNLLDIESSRADGVFTDETICVGCARLGSPDQRIVAGKAKDVIKMDFGRPLQCLVVPGKLHFMEEDALKLWQ